MLSGRLGDPSLPPRSHPSPCQLASLPTGQLMKVNPGGGEGIGSLRSGLRPIACGNAHLTRRSPCSSTPSGGSHPFGWVYRPVSPLLVPTCHLRNESWRRGRDWLRYASGLHPDPADRLFAPEGSPNLGSHPFGWHERLYSILETLYSSTLKFPGGGEGIRTPGTLRFI